MKSILWSLTLKLKRKPYWIQIVIFFLLTFLFIIGVMPFIFLADQLTGENNNSPDLTSWILVIMLAPILETFLNQHLPFKLMQKWRWTKNRYGLYIFVSAIVFGLCHTYSLQYMIFAFSGGLVLGYTYFFYSKTPNKAFWSTALIHALKNSFAILMSTIFDKL